jgi:chemosensory pili system protein ChpA (sensor histidine kinase/response regulator)
MNDHQSALAPQFDTAPLSWVIGEIRDALERSAKALQDAAGRSVEAQASLLLHAKTHLHQAHGALQVIDVAGVQHLLDNAERAIDRFRDGAQDLTPERAAVLAETYRALVEYLEDLLQGAAPQPVRLFPYYQKLQEVLGAERVHPGAMLALDQQPRLPGSDMNGTPDVTPDGAPDYAAARTRYERALLPFLKSEGDARRGHAAAMRDALAGVVVALGEPHAHGFWLALQTVADLVAQGQVEADLYVKQLFGQVNMQLRRMAQGQTDLPEVLLRDALFFIAAAPEPTLEARQLRAAWGLDGQVPPDYLARRYGRIDPAVLQDAKQALAATKQGWSRVAGDEDTTDAAAEGDAGEFDEALAKLAGASEKLGAPELAHLLRELGQAASQSRAAGRSDRLGLEMAAAMLFVEHGLDQVRQLPEDFGQHAEEVGQRLLALAHGQEAPEPPQWQGDMARELQQGQTVAVLAGEIRAGLRQVEKLVEEYHQHRDRRAALEQADPLLHQLQGALDILDQDAATRAVAHVRDAVRTLADGASDAQHAQDGVLDNIAHNIGALGFFTDALAQNVDNARRRFRFDDATGLFNEPAFDVAAPAPSAAQPSAAQPAAADRSAAPEVEGELLAVFISEAHEVLDVVAQQLPALHAAPGDGTAEQEGLTHLRRAFHTLKGSSRMVGLDGFAQAAAAVEKLLNGWLAEGKAVTTDLLALIDYAHVELAAWVAELAEQGEQARSADGARDADVLIAACARMGDGGPFLLARDESAPAFGEGLAGEIDDALAEAGGRADNVKRIGALEIPLPLYHIYLAEAGDLLQTLETDFAAWRAAPGRAASSDALKAAHTLAGTAATVGFGALREIAVALEDVLQAATAPLDGEQHALLHETVERLRIMLQVFGLGELPPAQPELLARLAALRGALGDAQGNVQDDAQDDVPPAGPEDDLAQRMDALFAATYASILADPPPSAGLAPLAAPDTPRPVVQHEADPAVAEVDDLFDTYFDDPFAAPTLEQAAPAPESGAAEPVAEAEPQADIESAAEAEELPDAAAMVEHEPEPEPERISEPPAPPAQPSADADIALPAEPVFADELDPDLLPVFLEEAADLLPQIGDGLRRWQQDPSDTGVAQALLRALHTAKGSARMAGAMRMGQHTHALETQIENMLHAGATSPAAFEELLADYDGAQLLFEQLRDPGRGAGAAQADAEDGGAHAPAAPQPAPQISLVRVRADILDRLVNQAGEVSIARSRLESQVGTLKVGLSEFADNLARLRRQLREVEMQAESQIASRLSIAGEREFDPLEFDRFTRLQELTRMMAESVDDVGSLHDSLARSVDGASDNLVAQGRLTRELQRDLMRVRMVPFASLSDRLFRVARQTAKETDKRVNLDILGGAVEIDRSVLERMAAPFEHLLRNAIVHGIEPRDVRLAAGKPETGELLVQVSQQGNEVALRFADDGAGLDLERIRTQAQAKGLLPDGLSDQKAAELIFTPGFSTADALTELAGRGIGMDVVRSEARALGGRVEIATEAGQGAAFTIHLPLTLAVTQVVLVASGARTHALPANLVEQVVQVREADLAEARAAGKLALPGEDNGQALALHYLPALLRESGAPAAVAGEGSPRICHVLVVRSGATRLALEVDAVLGNREVVVKNVGPQLARMPGIAGATVLGSGEVVLILDPVQLLALSARAAEQAPALPPMPAPAVHAATVMVVDDSLTVRKVSQRLLEREGYRVLLAKDGVDALEQMATIRPDLMLVDIEMPRMDGFDLTRQVRGMDATRAIPIIMITSRSADKHRNLAFELGVDAYFGKPFQEEALLAEMNRLLAREHG